MADIEITTQTQDETFDLDAVVIGADSQEAAAPSVFRFSTIWTYLKTLTNTWAGVQTFSAGAVVQNGLTVNGGITTDEGVYYSSGGTDVPVADGGTGASTAAAARTSLGVGTGASPQFSGVNIGHATDTTLARASAGQINVEGVQVATASNTLTLTNKTLTTPTINGAALSGSFSGTPNFQNGFVSNALIITNDVDGGDSSRFVIRRDGNTLAMFSVRSYNTDALEIRGPSSTTTNELAAGYDAVTGWTLRTDSTVRLSIDQSGNTDILTTRFDTGGNVGIGTTSPSTKLHVNGSIRHLTYTVATLPAAGTVGAGTRAAVTDANATTFNSTVAGGGANFVPVISNGTNWRIG